MAWRPDELRAAGNALPRPFEHCYWLLPGRLLAGEHPAARGETSLALRLEALQAAQVTAFIDLTAPHEGLTLYTPRAGRRLSFPIADFDVPSATLLRHAIDAMDHALGRGEVVYLHCRAGIGRTGTVAACWLVERGLAPAEALRLLQGKFEATAQSRGGRTTPETAMQRALVDAWAAPR